MYIDEYENKLSNFIEELSQTPNEEMTDLNLTSGAVRSQGKAVREENLEENKQLIEYSAGYIFLQLLILKNCLLR